MTFALANKIADKSVRIGIIGLGYVGLPLAYTFWNAGLDITGFDIDTSKIERLNKGQSHIRHFDHETVEKMAGSGRFRATADFADLSKVDAILICVPTPLGPTREPDLQFVISTSEAIAAHFKQGSLVVLESTTYPGTTTEVVQPILETSGMKAGADFLLAFSPEREDPGSGVETRRIPKVVGGIDKESGDLSEALYKIAFESVYRVGSAEIAEAVKITENVFRAVNIALVNELKIAYSRMGINVWDVIDAAKTKPFGFMAFYPGPGLGGHCIPIDPFYLSWRAKSFEVDTRFIELAGEINRAMPRLVVQELSDCLSMRFSKALKGARILIMGMAYKKNVDDIRESPALHIMELLKVRGAEVEYHDPYCAEIPSTREYAQFKGKKSISFDEATVSRFDAALITTDHDSIDYAALVKWSKLVVDTRNATKRVTEGREKIALA